MARISIFADESGNFDFSRKNGASRYFILTTIACRCYTVGDVLLNLRRELVWADLGLESDFHATSDEQAVRDRVFQVIQAHDFRIDVTVLEKAKAAPQTCISDERFYQLAWYLHMKHVAPRVVSRGDELFVVGASLGTKKKRALMHQAVRDVIRQVSPTVRYRTASWSAQSEPCLQVADYCCWAVSRKWERGDTRSYDLISDKIASEFDAFKFGKTLYY
ncbi:MAG: DUF3800 domain-containing protein [Gemmatimonadetes bacterium]|nr:DUF3800 domain-containing protein [Gemmatimonadota bacterium]MBA4159169.1 DUF3800 domain-containing protein [Gemmatimonadota bacterium]